MWNFEPKFDNSLGLGGVEQERTGTNVGRIRTGCDELQAQLSSCAGGTVSTGPVGERHSVDGAVGRARRGSGTESRVPEVSGVAVGVSGDLKKCYVFFFNIIRRVKEGNKWRKVQLTVWAHLQLESRTTASFSVVQAPGAVHTLMAMGRGSSTAWVPMFCDQTPANKQGSRSRKRMSAIAGPNYESLGRAATVFIHNYYLLKKPTNKQTWSTTWVVSIVWFIGHQCYLRYLRMDCQMEASVSPRFTCTLIYSSCAEILSLIYCRCL